MRYNGNKTGLPLPWPRAWAVTAAQAARSAIKHQTVSRFIAGREMAAGSSDVRSGKRRAGFRAVARSH